MLATVDYPKLKKHQAPSIGWFLADVILRSALTDAAVLHSGLVQKERSALVEEINDPSNPLQALVLLYDVSPHGLNLHPACDKAFEHTIPRSFGHSTQLGDCPHGVGVDVAIAMLLS